MVNASSSHASFQQVLCLYNTMHIDRSVLQSDKLRPKIKFRDYAMPLQHLMHRHIYQYHRILHYFFITDTSVKNNRLVPY